MPCLGSSSKSDTFAGLSLSIFEFWFLWWQYTTYKKYFLEWSDCILSDDLIFLWSWQWWHSLSMKCHFAGCMKFCFFIVLYYVCGLQFHINNYVSYLYENITVLYNFKICVGQNSIITTLVILIVLVSISFDLRRKQTANKWTNKQNVFLQEKITLRYLQSRNCLKCLEDGVRGLKECVHQGVNQLI